MTEHDVLSALFTDRTESSTGLLNLIQDNEVEPALLLSLQLLSDVIVHCSDYIPKAHPYIAEFSTRTFSSNTEGEYPST